MWFQKISITPPPRKGSDFQGGREAICLIFQWGGGGGQHREIFPEGSRDAQEGNKEKHKNLPRQFICEDIKHDKSYITNIFCQSLGVTSHAKMFLTVCRFRTDLASVQKKLSSVRTTWAIRLKKVVIRSNGLGYPFEKSVSCSNGPGYPFEKLRICRRSSD